MNNLLKEFLSYILVEAKSTASKQAADMGLKFIRGSKKYWSKNGKKPASHKTDDSGNIVAVGKDEQPGRAGTSAAPKQPPERYGSRTGQYVGWDQQPTSQQAAQSSLGKITQAFGKLTSSLSKMTKQFRKDVYSGTAAGIGTKESTQGETSSCAAAQDFLAGRKLTVGEHNHDVPSNVTDADIKRERSKLKGKKALEPDATRNAIMQAWIEKEKLRYTSEGNSPPSDKWLKYAYRAGFSTSRMIQERGANMQATAQAIAKGAIPSPTVTGKEGRKECLTLLQGMVENATTTGEKRHYEKALIALKYAEDTDTAAFYVDKAGRVSVVLISNKQTGNDPHGNTTASARMRRVRESAKTSDVPDEIVTQIEDTIRQAETILSSGGDVTGVGRQHFSNPKVAKRAADILNDMFKSLPADKGRNKDYTQDIIEKAGGKLREKPYGKAMAAVYCIDNPKNCTNGIPSVNVSDEYLAANAGRAFVYAVQTSQGDAPYLRKILMKVGTVASTSDGATKKLFAPITEGSDNMRKAAKDAHEEIVSRLQTIDTQYCGENPDKCKDEADNDINGPATQLYVDTFMRDTHWDQYICNSDNCTEQDAISENKLVDINGHKVTPKKFRECLTTLTGFTPSDNTTDSHESQRELWSHLKRKLKISPKEASISVHGVDTTIGKETYRTKGDSASLLTFLGKNMTECVTGGAE